MTHRIALDEFLALGDQDAAVDGALHFEQVEFDHPLVILYSSGTTGSPKCIVHSHGVRVHSSRVLSSFSFVSF